MAGSSVWEGKALRHDDGVPEAALEELRRLPCHERLVTTLESMVAASPDRTRWLHLLGELVRTLSDPVEGIVPRTTLQPLIEALARSTSPTLEACPSPPHHAAAKPRHVREAVIPFPAIREGDGMPMRCLPQQVFRNWGRTVENTPGYTFVPRSIAGVCNIVRWASAHGKRVRCAGYRHTWSDFYSADDQVLISMLPLDVVEELPATEPGIDPDNTLQGIELVGTLRENGVEKALCRIGAATTNEQFRRWCLHAGGGNWAWTIPLNVIMVEITWGGSNAPICHGAGWRNETLSDLVTAVEFVNARGELQVVDTPDLLKAAAGCFGLLGVVTAITVKLDPMSFASMRPRRRKAVATIPPPDGFEIPAPLREQWMRTPKAEREAAWTRFCRACEENYYAEWFWFAYQPDCWVNTWANDGSRDDACDYPSPQEARLQEWFEYLGQCVNDSAAFKGLSGVAQGALTGMLAMAMLPDVTDDQPAIVAPLIDALHFRRGIQNMRVRDMELELPIPARADDPDKPDWNVCRRAWWNAIAVVYRRADGPMRIALEMRVMGGSGIDMAPQHGNRLGTCSIEVLSNLNVSDAEWQSFIQEIADCWMSETTADGVALNVRPHWAKEWQTLRLGDQSAIEYQRDVAYRESIPLFAARLRAVAEAGDTTLRDLQRMFSNPLLDELFRDVFRSPSA